VLGAFLEGWRRVLGAPAVTYCVLVVTVIAMLLFSSDSGRNFRGGLDRKFLPESSLDWTAAYPSDVARQVEGARRTFSYELLGIKPGLSAAALVYVALWMFLWGGILDRLARARPVRMFAFSAACGGYFFRLLRLAVVAGVALWALFYPLQRFPVAFVLAVVLIKVLADFAMVRLVVEDRRSVLGALSGAIRFVRTRPFRVLGLTFLNLLSLLIVLRLWYSAAPGAEAPVWSALLLSLVYLLFLLWARLAFLASEVVFFQGELAHAEYTALPEPIWPDSPAVEAIQNLSTNRHV
jgi:hypothetical protein